LLIEYFGEGGFSGLRFAAALTAMGLLTINQKQLLQASLL